MSERFFSRWSRLKREAESDPEAVPEASAPAESGVPPAVTAPEPSEPAPPAPKAQADELPALDSLDLASDFSAFLKKEVSESLRRAALKKLFSDPHFNRMDGLDIYIDDYSVADPIPPDVLERLRQARDLLQPDASPTPSHGEPALTTPRMAEESSQRPVPAAADGQVPEATPAGEPDLSARDGDAPQQCDTLGQPGQNVPPDLSKS